MSNTTTNRRQLAAQIHPNSAKIAMQTAMHRGYGLHITPVLTAEGHVATQVDLVVPDWERLADEPDAENIIASFVDDMKNDLEMLIAGGLAESAVAYVRAKVSGEAFSTPVRGVEQDAEGNVTVTDKEV